jgi:hypothetical protein
MSSHWWQVYDARKPSNSCAHQCSIQLLEGAAYLVQQVLLQDLCCCWLKSASELEPVQGQSLGQEAFLR